MSQMGKAPAAAPQDPAGQPPAGNTDAQGQGDTAPDGSSEFTLDVPPEYADYAPDFEAYQGAAGQWLKDNPQATAAEALKFAADYQAKTVGELMGQQQQQHQQMVSQWESAARADQEIGGDRFGENLAIAKTAIDKFATPELKQMLDETGVGNHPEMVRAFFRAGKLLQEAPIVGTTTGTGRKTLTQALYGNS